MFFHIEHTTEFVYPQPAVEAFSEMRLRPRDSLRQTVSHHYTRVDPPVLIEDHEDYFGNYVETVSVPFRHNKLTVTSICDVETEAHRDALSDLNLTISEARLLYRSKLRELYDFLSPSVYVPFSEDVNSITRELLPPTEDFAAAIKRLNEWIFREFKYTPGATDVNTSVAEFVRTRKGVCQDFAHLMICVCRMAGIPARYVSGYIETDPAPEDALVGATASHAWVEICAPNGFWIGMDPTNNIMESERHVQIGIGRDYHDVPPLKGIFKGTNRQTMSVAVSVSRNELTGAKRARSEG